VATVAIVESVVNVVEAVVRLATGIVTAMTVRLAIVMKVLRPSVLMQGKGTTARSAADTISKKIVRVVVPMTIMRIVRVVAVVISKRIVRLGGRMMIMRSVLAAVPLMTTMTVRVVELPILIAIDRHVVMRKILFHLVRDPMGTGDARRSLQRLLRLPSHRSPQFRNSMRMGLRN
jgi:hypothetical protein